VWAAHKGGWRGSSAFCGGAVMGCSSLYALNIKTFVLFNSPVNRRQPQPCPFSISFVREKKVRRPV